MAATPAKATPVLDTEPTNTPDEFSYKHATFDEVLEDLSSRFILNLPEDELAEVERVCFQVEQAHWYYEDFIREENPSFHSLPLKKFSEILFRSCPLLHHWSHDHETAFNGFINYKTRVPVCGAVMLNEALTKCVLVKGWKSSAGWGFPKGKVNENEDEAFCAVREVLEETGYNLSGKIRRSDCIRLEVKQQPITLFVVAGVPEDFNFKTQTRKEISKIDWFKLADLPTWKKNRSTSSKFYLITPAVGPLKAIVRNLRKTRKATKPPSHQTIETDPLPTGEDEPETDEVDATMESPKSIERSSRSQSCEAEISSSQSSSIDPHTPSVNGDFVPQSVSDEKHIFKDDYPEVVGTQMDPGVATDSPLSAFNNDSRSHWSRLMMRLNHSQESSTQTTPQALTPTPGPVDSPRPDLHSAGGDLAQVNGTTEDFAPKRPPPTRPLSSSSSLLPLANRVENVAPRGLPVPVEQLVKRTRQLQLLESVVAEDTARQSTPPHPAAMSAYSYACAPGNEVHMPRRSASVNPEVPRSGFAAYHHHQHKHSVSGPLPPPLLHPPHEQSPLYLGTRPPPYGRTPSGALSVYGGHPTVDSIHKGQMLSILSGGYRGPITGRGNSTQLLSILNSSARGAQTREVQGS